jgi:hypothetical protein
VLPLLNDFIREDKCDISRYLPDFLKKDKAFSDDLNVLSAEQDRLRGALIDVFNQFFIKTATWGLDNWENILGLPTDKTLTYTQRRAIILLKLQSKQTSTLDYMIKLVKRYYAADANATVEERNAQYLIRIVAEKTPYDPQGLIEALETYKPAHLAYEIVHLILGDTAFYATTYMVLSNVTTIDMCNDIGTVAVDSPIYIGGVVKLYHTIELEGHN